MSIYRFLSLAVCPVLILQFAIAAPPTNAPLTSKAVTGFIAEDVAMMNSFKRTHHLLKIALSGKNIPPGITSAMTAQLTKKDILLPEFKFMVDGTVQFQMQNQTHNLSRESNNNLRLNGKLIDLNSKDWTTDVSFQIIPLFGLPVGFIGTASAVAPLAVLVVGAMMVILGGVVCSAPNIKISGAKTIQLGNTATERAINEMIRDARRQVCRAGCDIACAASTSGEFDHLAYLNGLCADVAKKFATASDVERSSQEFEPIVNPRQRPRTLLMVEVSRVNHERGQTLTLDSIDQQILSGLTNDPAIMQWCVSKTFTAQGEPAQQGNRQPAIVQ